MHLDLESSRGLNPGRDPVHLVLVETGEFGRPVVTPSGRYGYNPQDRLTRHDRVRGLNLCIDTLDANEREARRRELRQLSQNRLLRDFGACRGRLFGQRRLIPQEPQCDPSLAQLSHSAIPIG